MEKYVGPTTVQVLKIPFMRLLSSYDWLSISRTTEHTRLSTSWLFPLRRNPTNKHLSTMKSSILAFSYKKNEYGEWIMLGERSGCERVV